MAHLQRLRLRDQHRLEPGQHAALDVDAIRRDTRLAGMAPLQRHQLRHRPIQIRIRKHEERTIAAELEGALLGPRDRTVARHQPTDRRRARERDLGGARVRAQRLAQPRRRGQVGGQDVEGARGEARAGGEIRERQHAEGGFRAGLDDHAAAGGEGGAGFAQHHGDGEVPGYEGHRDADGLFDGEESSAWGRGREDGALDAVGFAREPPGEAEGVVELAEGFVERFAGFVGDDFGWGEGAG